MRKISIVIAHSYIRGTYTFTAWMETQRQTNDDAITVGGQNPMLVNSINKNWIF